MSPSIVHDRTPDCHPDGWVIGCMDDLTTGGSFDSQPTWVVDVLGLLFWHVIDGCLYNQALAASRPTSAGI